MIAFPAGVRVWIAGGVSAAQFSRLRPAVLLAQDPDE